jgi:hypothetical protein
VGVAATGTRILRPERSQTIVSARKSAPLMVDPLGISVLSFQIVTSVS